MTNPESFVAGLWVGAITTYLLACFFWPKERDR